MGVGAGVGVVVGRGRGGDGATRVALQQCVVVGCGGVFGFGIGLG